MTAATLSTDDGESRYNSSQRNDAIYRADRTADRGGAGLGDYGERRRARGMDETTRLSQDGNMYSTLLGVTSFVIFCGMRFGKIPRAGGPKL